MITTNWRGSHGVFELGVVDISTGKRLAVQVGENIVLYGGLDLLCSRLIGNTPVAVNGMYLEFQNGGTPPVITPDPADGRAYYAAMEPGVGDADYLRIPFASTPILSSTDETKFVSNKATFFAMSTGYTVGRGGHDFLAAAGSIVYGIALVAIPDVDDASQDIVFSRSYDFTPVEKEAGQEISMSWAHIFGESMISSS